MKLLQYKSNEMFSATQLIRKSKMLFDKIVNNEIDKAIILRDGKPTFMLMDFSKYENIMSEYEELKQMSKELVPKKKSKKKEKKRKEKIQRKSVDKTEISLTPTFPLPVDKPKNKIESAQPIRPVIKEENSCEIKKDIDNLVEEPTEQEEISEAMKSLDNINLADDMKIIAQQKVKDRILQARKEREKQKEEDLRIIQEEEEQEKKQLLKIKKETQVKQEALSDFWA